MDSKSEHRLSPEQKKLKTFLIKLSNITIILSPPMGTTNRVRMLLLMCMLAMLMFLLYNNEVPQVFKQFGNNSTQTTSSLQQFYPADDKGRRHERWRQFLIRFKNIRLKYWMEFANDCPEKTKLIMLSMARRDGFEKRKGIRETWMKDSVPGEVIRFLIADATEGEANDIQKKLEQEQTKHGDLVFLHGFSDIYTHIHLKWYGGLQWQQSFCSNAEWVMKADDDSVIHLRRLAYWTEKKFLQIAVQHPLVYIGYIYFSPQPIRDKNSKWYISEDVYPLDWYPDFMQGTVYLATPATITAILLHSREIVGFYLDDVVFTGILAELANVTLVDQKMHFIWGFSYDAKHGQCEDGVPTALSMWGAGSLRDYVHHYGRLKSIRCKKN